MSLLKISDLESTKKQLIRFIQENLYKFHKNKILIGISGGLDCAVCTKLALEAVGKENIVLVHLKERDTPHLSTKHAKLLAQSIGVPLIIKNVSLPLLSFGVYSFQSLIGFLVPERVKAEYARWRYNLLNKNDHFYYKRLINALNVDFKKDKVYFEDKSRLITLYLYHYADLNNALVIDTANKTELSTGYYVVYGQAGDIMPLASLYKTQVKQLGKYLGLPQEIINRPPAPDIIPGLTDEFILGISYEKLDQILYALENQWSVDKIQKELSYTKEEIENVKNIYDFALQLEQIPLHFRDS
jgi:NAD+ synthase